MSEAPTSPQGASLLLQLLESTPDAVTQPLRLARLDMAVLDYLHTKASDLHHRAVTEAREFLEVALESMEADLSPERQRRFVERADDALAYAQHWGGLAANARFCREHPDLARQLADGEAPASPSRDVCPDTACKSRQGRRARAVRKSR